MRFFSFLIIFILVSNSCSTLLIKVYELSLDTELVEERSCDNEEDMKLLFCNVIPLLVYGKIHNNTFEKPPSYQTVTVGITTQPPEFF